MIIYQATNKINGNFYIGKTKNEKFIKRKAIHKWQAFKQNSNQIFHRAIRKYGFENFDWEIIERAINYTELSELERYYIFLGQPRYNMTKGGEGTLGLPSNLKGLTKDNHPGIKRISEANKGRKTWNTGLTKADARVKKILESLHRLPGFKGKKHSEKAKEKNRDAHLGQLAWNKGKAQPEETKNKIREKATGRLHSEQTKQFLSKKFKGRISPLRGRSLSEEHKKKISENSARNAPWKGIPMDEETKIKISNTLKGRVPWNKGISPSEETRKKQAEKMKGRKFGPCSEERKKNISEAKRIKRALRLRPLDN